jgi:phage-related protein
VLDYLSDLDNNERAEIKRFIRFLQVNNGKLLMPYSRYISKKIWELRVKYINHHHRILYFLAPNKKIVLLSAFLKKSNKTPQNEIIKANVYYSDYLLNL